MTPTSPFHARRARARRGPAAAAAVLAGLGLVTVAATRADAAAGCTVDYTVNQWSTGFTATVAVTNLGEPLNGWTLAWDYAGNQRITESWNSTYTQNGRHVTLRNADWNARVGTNATVSPGFNASYSGVNDAPTGVTLNGTPCDGGDQPPPTTAPSTTTPPTTTPPTTTPPTSPSPAGSHVDNPYVGVKGYVNPEWKARADAEPGGSRVSDNPTGVWLDRIAAINGVDGGMGVRAHLDAALSQGAGYIQFVIYDLPGRDCAALASNGELGPTEIGRYESGYIDPIAAIEGDPRYRDLRIINIIEIDSLPNLVTNVSGATATPACQTMQANGNYRNGIAYALSRFHAIGNVYNYLDAGHHGWLGWDSNFGPAADLFASVAKSATGGVDTVDGFITDTANYSALVEPYFTIDTTVGGTSVRQSTWVDWNRYVDELSFAQAFRTRLISEGFNPGLGMLIDTSRNGWGGPDRPKGPSTSTDVNAFVDASRVDRRIHPGNWCNQAGAGLGERPTAAPAPGVDAYVWIKPPGESDGASSAIPNDQGKGFDRMCDPTYTGNARNGNSMSGALPGAPLSGDWFSAQFQELMRNAYPPL